MNETWLAHHGIKGQKWGVRRFQNPDGTLTKAGRKRLGMEMEKDASEMKKKHYQKINDLEYELNKKATDYADQHHIDYDDILDGDLTSEASRSRELKRITKLGVSKKEAEHTIEYNRLLQEAEAKTSKAAKDGYDKINKDIMKKYGGYGLDDIKFLKKGYNSKNGLLQGKDKTAYLLKNIGAVTAVTTILAGAGIYASNKKK